jgi:hypothetical protein
MEAPMNPLPTNSLPTNPHKLKPDVRLMIATPKGNMLTTPMTYFDACIAVRAFEAMGTAREDIQTITDQRSLREIDAEQKQAGKTHQFGLATFEKSDGSKYSQMAIGPAGQDLSPEMIQALGTGQLMQPELSEPDQPGLHPGCGELPTGHYEQQPACEAGDDSAPAAASQQKLDARSCAYIAEPISTLGLVVLGWTCWRVVASRFAGRLMRVLIGEW